MYYYGLSLWCCLSPNILYIDWLYDSVIESWVKLRFFISLLFECLVKLTKCSTIFTTIFIVKQIIFFWACSFYQTVAFGCKTTNFMGCLPLAVTTYFFLTRGSKRLLVGTDWSAIWRWSKRHLTVLCINEIVPRYVVYLVNSDNVECG